MSSYCEGWNQALAVAKKAIEEKHAKMKDYADRRYYMDYGQDNHWLNKQLGLEMALEALAALPSEKEGRE